jgi:hypothetical protein
MFTGTYYLGCCSYESEEDFVENSGYYEDLKYEARGELVETLRKAAMSYDELITRET